jgi:uncharacterized protein YoxC
MEILLWVVGIHLCELLALGGYLIISKNRKLENAIVSQQQHIDTLSIIISRLSDSLKEINSKMWVEGDEELQAVFQEIKEIQSILEEVLEK